MNYLYLDTETTAINPRGAGPPEFVAAGWAYEDGPVRLTQDREQARALVLEAWQSGVPVVAHNLPFDLSVLGLVPTRDDPVWCTMLADLLIRLREHDCENLGVGHNARIRSLADCFGRDIVGKGTVQLGFRPGVPLTADQREYLERDVLAVRSVHQAQLKKGVPGKLTELNLQVRAAMALQRLEQTGLDVDRVACVEERRGCQKIRRAAARVLQKAGIYHPVRKGPRGGTYKERLDTAAMRALATELAKARDMEVQLTPKGGVSTATDFLQDLSDDERVQAWLDYKSAQKLEGYLAEWEKSERIHPKYTWLLRTGRTSCSSPNIQQVPSRGKKGRVKRAFVAPPGRLLWELDYGQLELCCLAYLTQGQMLARIRAGEDLHRYLGGVYFRKPAAEVTKEERQLMKCCFTPDVEFLTPQGWRTFDQLGTGPVMQADPVPGGQPVLSWGQPHDYIDQQAEEIVSLRSENVRLDVTPDHRMLAMAGTGNPVVCSPEELPTRRAVWGAGQLGGGEAVNPAMIRLAVATAADGSYSGRQITFGFTKRRKVQRLQKLLAAVGASTTQKTYSNGDSTPQTTLKIRPPLADSVKALLDNKRLPWWWLRLSHEARAAAVNEARFWDASRTARSYQFVSTSRQNIDVLQALAISVGRRATEGKAQEKQNTAHATCYKLTVADRSWSRADSIAVVREPRRGRVVCLSVPSGYLVVRQNGTVSIQGNCNFGLPGGMGASKFRKFIRANGLPDPGHKAATDLRNAWLAAYPEMTRWLEEDEAHRPYRRYQSVWAGTYDGNDYEHIERAWRLAWKLTDGKKLPGLVRKKLAAREGSWLVERWVMGRRVLTHGGRIRYPVSYTEQRNTRFQGLAANLAKDALARVVLDHPDLCTVHAFVHDSLLISAPESVGLEHVKVVAQVMLEAAAKWLPGILVRVAITGPGRNWYEAKHAEEVQVP